MEKQISRNVIAATAENYYLAFLDCFAFSSQSSAGADTINVFVFVSANNCDRKWDICKVV
jgi:hypothetical protein